MGDDWRLTVDFDDERDGTQLVEWLAAFEFAHDERAELGDRVIVSRDGARVFLYTDSEARAREIETLVRERLESEGRSALVALECWHPVEEAWKDAAIPLPQTEAELAAEREAHQEREEYEAVDSGHAEWEVRVELRRHRDTVELARRLEDDGFVVVRRFRYLLVGAATEEEARALAARLKEEAPEGATVHVQPGGEMVWEVAPRNPFTFIGGLGA
jgi:hypothetical protein